MRRAGALLGAVGSVLLLGGAHGVAHAGDDSLPQYESRGGSVSLIDNSHADSWLEIDRTANQEVGSGTAGSDHDGSEIRVSHSPLARTGLLGVLGQGE